ncbi:hypothetical protein HY061_00510, partial [Candidatus Azambacteria bacterium]|nr:hypothetical protein [Candidatus Azambacteria bacterium]
MVILIATLPSYYFYNQYKKVQQQLQNLPKSVEARQQLIDTVARLIELPKGEAPLVATVSDASKLKNQPFFQVAANGDKVLIYAKAKKAILYRPSTNKIIDVEPVSIKNN